MIASKVIAYQQRRGQPKSGTDWRDIAMLLLKFPELKEYSGLVNSELKTAGATTEAFEAWRELVSQEIRAAADDEDL